MDETLQKKKTHHKQTDNACIVFVDDVVVDCRQLAPEKHKNTMYM